MSETEEDHIELEPGLCYADFSPGDRIYSTFSQLKFGTVVYVDPSQINISWDDNYLMILSHGIFVSLTEQLKAYGKPLDLSRVEKGSIISRKYPGQERVYAEVMAYGPGEFLSFWYLKDSSALCTVGQDKDHSLEERLMYWELEG